MSIASGVFFIVGAQRCGTSLLREVLDQHPDIEMARPFNPEPRWFLRPDRAPGVEPFLEALFDQQRSPLWRGEKATSYLEFADVAAVLDDQVPGARVIISLRDPIERALSHYAYSVSSGIEQRPIEVALSPDLREPDWDPTSFSVSPYAYIRRGRYIDYLVPYLDTFGDRLKVVLFEHLVTGDAIPSLVRWLGLEPHTTGDAPARVNAADRPDASPSQGLLRMLAHEFEEPNAELAATLGLDLAAWGRRGGFDE